MIPPRGKGAKRKPRTSAEYRHKIESLVIRIEFLSNRVKDFSDEAASDLRWAAIFMTRSKRLLEEIDNVPNSYK